MSPIHHHADSDLLPRSLVLVADSDRQMRISMMERLRHEGFDVIGAAEGDEALEVAYNARPDAVIVDLALPEVDGLKVIAWIRSDRHLDDMTVLVANDTGDDEVAGRAMSGGADGVIGKGLGSSELARQVRLNLRFSQWGQNGAEAAWSDDGFDIDEDRESIDWIIARQAFDISFQPIVSFRTSDVVAQKAIVEFHDSTTTEVFQRSAACDRLVALELALLEHAILTVGNIPLGQSLHVNLSSLTASAREIAELSDRCDRPIVIEITEPDFFSTGNPQALRDVLPFGCMLAADDTGILFAALTTMLDVRPEVIKIDRALVHGIDGDAGRQAIVADLVEYSATTDSMLVAEGVERVEERDALFALGVEFGHGGHLG